MTGVGGRGIAAVAVNIVETDHHALTGTSGEYRLSAVPPGTWTVRFSGRQATVVESGVSVVVGQTTRLDVTVDWQVHFGEAVTVTSASRRRERVFDAPATVTSVTADEIARRAASSQAPKLLELTPGMELTQSGLYDFNVNTRGFNGPLTRRIAVLVDGRDPSIPFLGAQEWATFSLPLDDLETLEVARGPSAAIYGPNASSGVLNFVTKPPQASAGGMLRLTAGELATANFDIRWAGETLGRQTRAKRKRGGGWWKLLASSRSSDTFAVSRRGAAEYALPCPSQNPCLPQEAVDPAVRVEGWAGSVRFDRDFGDRFDLTLEVGGSSVDGVTVLTNLGRNTIFEVERPWARARLSHRRWNLQATYGRRHAPVQTALSSGLDFVLDSEKWTLEAQVDRDLGDRVRWVVGGSFRDEAIDSFDPARGVQTLLFEPVSDQAVAAFAQLEWQATPRLKLFLAGRFDDSELFYDGELSPKASLVWSPRPSHTLRFSYNQAFQAANYVEKLVQADVAPGLPLQALEAFCAPFGVACGFAGPATRLLAVGNPDLGVERVRAFEIGYRALLGRSAFLTLDVYRSDNEDFITDLLPELTTPLGDVNRFFGPYRPPDDLPPAAAEGLRSALGEALGPRLPFLTNNLDGDPFLALLTYGSFGEVTTQGVELAGRYAPGKRWSFSASTSFFDFDLKRSLPGLDQILSPNAPEHQARAAVTYTGERLSFDLSGRWASGFFWASGVFAGDVPSYTTYDLSGNYRWNDRLSVGVHVSNLASDEHYEAFGGDLLGRRALGSLTYRW